MNERIRELAEQAGITTNIDTDYFEKNINRWVDYYSEKFAELIVKECAKVCVDRGTHHDGLYSAWASDCSERIEKHFGVES
jgi:hypothetical protein